MSNKGSGGGATILYVAGTAVVAFATGFWFRGTTLTPGEAGAPAKPSAAAPAAPGAAPAADKTVYKVPVANSAVRGPEDALVTIVEFSDFQCPFCSRVGPTLKQIESEYGNKVRIAFKHNPLPFHQQAPLAAEAALAAHDQGKFWPMHDKLFSNQQALDRASLEKYGEELGLDMAKFKQALDENAHSKAIEEDKALAASLGANGTPSFFINGRSLRGAQPFPSFKTLIDEEISKAEERVRAGTPKKDVYAKLTENGLTKAAPAPAPAQKQAPAGRRKVEFAKDDPAKGGKAPKVTIVEFSDFQCPFCSRVVPTLKQIHDTYKDDVKVIFKQNPLPFHKDAPLAAEAALAANEQGKFWEMHDKLFENQSALDRASLESYAQSIGLNIAKFKAALDSNKFKTRWEADQKYANSISAGGTPAFFVNGKFISGAQPFESFKTTIDEEIKKANEYLAKGIKREALYAEFMKDAGNAPPPAAAGDDEDSKPANVPVGSSAIKGDAKAPVTIIEFSDFECPFCSRVGPTLKEIEDKYKGKVKVAFKHQPLPFHASAMLAAQAAEAAKEQGKFWEMHDKMFANQRALSRENLIAYAKEIGLDTGKFEKALDSDKVKQQIAADQADARSAGANGTPTFFINGRRVVGAQPFDAFKNVIDEELKKKGT